MALARGSETEGSFTPHTPLYHQQAGGELQVQRLRAICNGGLGEPEYGCEFFAGLTGDVFTQVYAFDHFRGDYVTDFLLSAGRKDFVEDIFAQCDYEAPFVPEKRVKAEKEVLLEKILGCIDWGVPVIGNLMISGHIS